MIVLCRLCDAQLDLDEDEAVAAQTLKQHAKLHTFHMLSLLTMPKVGNFVDSLLFTAKGSPLRWNMYQEKLFNNVRIGDLKK